MEAILVLGSLGLILGLILAVSNKYLHVKEDQRIAIVEEMLPGYNCGACGTPGCSAFANKIVCEGMKPQNCKPISADSAELIVKYMEENPEEIFGE